MSAVAGGAIIYDVTSISDLRDRLYEQAASWQLTPEVGQEALVRLACDALVGGASSPGVVQLAGMSTRGQDYDFEEAVAAALDDVDLTLPTRDSAEAQTAAARAVCGLVIDGRLSARELARWAHVHIGHSGARDMQTLVELDDAYDTVEYVHVGKERADLDKDVVAEARRLASARLVARWTGPSARPHGGMSEHIPADFARACICIVAAVVAGLMRLDSRRSARLGIAERTARHCSRMIGRDLRA